MARIQVGESFSMAMDSLWSSKLRTFLTTLGIVWGTVAVALLLAFGEGLHRHQVESFAGLGDHIVIAWPSRTSLPYKGLAKGRPVRLDDSDMAFVEQQVEVDDVNLRAFREEIPHEVKPARRDRFSITGWFRLNTSSPDRVDPPR